MRVEAAEAIRNLIKEIRMVPMEDGLIIEPVGEVASILALGQKQKSPRDKVEGARQVTLVAGARNTFGRLCEFVQIIAPRRHSPEAFDSHVKL